MPRIEEEGKGAVIANYTAATQLQQKDGHNTKANEHRDDDDTFENMVGSVLIGMESSPGQASWENTDFTSILANIRQEQSSPIILLFQSPEKEAEEDESHTNKEPSLGEKDSLHSLFSWGQRMRAQASVAANTAASAVATVAKERMQAKQQQQEQQSKTKEKSCDVFYQTSVGAFIPVNSLKESKVSTTSLLLVRKSATEALAPNKNHSFQWYRSSYKVPDTNDAASTASTGSSSAMSIGSCTMEGEWIALEGANHASFQPNTTLVGRRLRCQVRMAPRKDVASCSSSDSEDSDDDDDLNSVGSRQEEEIIDLKYPVVADLSLFNGARQALLRGAKFGVLKGRGNAQNHAFSIEVAIGVGKQHHKQVPMSAVTVHMTSGDETIQLTDKPIKQLLATADASNSKNLDLILPMLPDDGSMLFAMLTDGKLLLEASNRMTRESLLMTLGIANYQGRPGNLNGKTILYHDTVKVATLSLMDDASFSSASTSYASQLVSPEKSATSSMPPFQSPIPPIPQSVVSGDGNDDVSSLAKELDFLRAKLARKDKVVSELQRQVAKTEDVYQQTKEAFKYCQNELKQVKMECQQIRHESKSSEQTVRAKDAEISCIKKENLEHVASLESEMSKQSDKISELEKANRALQNEKAVLSAAVEARESKLEKMGDLQSSFDEMTEQVAKYDVLHAELGETKKRCEDVQKELEKVVESEKQCHSELSATLRKVESLTAEVKEKEEKAFSCLEQLEPLQKKNQQIKAERNSFKQKNDSLSKEILKICRNGRSVHDVERMVADHQSLLEEVELLRKQKRKALEDAHSYRTSYEQSKLVQEKSGLDNETRAALERNAELERLLAELTEYVSAKEMQLDTMKQVNEHLQDEIHSLAQANLSKNEV